MKNSATRISEILIAAVAVVFIVEAGDLGRTAMRTMKIALPPESMEELLGMLLELLQV